MAGHPSGANPTIVSYNASAEKIYNATSGLGSVDVMITIFCYFCQFSAKKLAFF
jgi:hypothetical protein